MNIEEFKIDLTHPGEPETKVYHYTSQLSE